MMDWDAFIRICTDVVLFKYTLISYICIATLTFIMFIWQLNENGRKQDKENMHMNCINTNRELPATISPMACSTSTQNPLMEIYEATVKSATQTNADRCIELLQCYPELVNIPVTASRFTPFLRACWTGNQYLVEYMLQHGADISVRTAAGESPFYLAVHRTSKMKDIWDPTLINLLYKSGCEVNARKFHGYTTLHVAAKNGHVALVRWLLVHGADPEYITNCGMKPVDVAFQLGHFDIVKLLTLKIKNHNYPGTPHPCRDINTQPALAYTPMSEERSKQQHKALKKSC